jgi:hypothetical protein
VFVPVFLISQLASKSEPGENSVLDVGETLITVQFHADWVGVNVEVAVNEMCVAVAVRVGSGVFEAARVAVVVGVVVKVGIGGQVGALFAISATTVSAASVRTAFRVGWIFTVGARVGARLLQAANWNMRKAPIVIRRNNVLNLILYLLIYSYPSKLRRDWGFIPIKHLKIHAKPRRASQPEAVGIPMFLPHIAGLMDWSDGSNRLLAQENFALVHSFQRFHRLDGLVLQIILLENGYLRP